MQSEKIIICGSGASIPFDSEKFKSEGSGLAPFLSQIIENNYSIGLNSWYKFACPTTISFVNDFMFYRKNWEAIGALPFVIARYNSQLYTREQYSLHANTLVLPDAKYYFGVDSWNIKNKKCLVCNYAVEKSDHLKLCPTCRTRLMKVGFYHGHLAGIISTTLAIALGFKKIYLLGLDCNETNGKTHFYQDLITDFKEYYGVGTVQTLRGTDYRTSTYNNPKKIINEYYQPLENDKSVEIFNVSLNSTIINFPKIDYPTFEEHFKDSNINQEQGRNELRNYIIEKTR